MIMMLVFYIAVSFPRWPETFGREYRCRFLRRSSRAPRTHTPCRCPSSSSNKACRSSLPQCARHCEDLDSEAAAADLSTSSDTAPTDREGRILLYTTTHRN